MNRFLIAQERVFDQALFEIQSGKKRTHWMWFVFPQLKGLGFSEMAQYYSIQSLDEAKEYLNHPILGQRLNLITHELLLLSENDANVVFGSPDDMKLKSCMTLFSLIDSSKESVFRKVLDKYFNGEVDVKTIDLIHGENN